jgi:hypothetical protein
VRGKNGDEQRSSDESAHRVASSGANQGCKDRAFGPLAIQRQLRRGTVLKS